MKKMNVGILLFDEVEVLDFAGPYETFAVTIDTIIIKSLMYLLLHKNMKFQQEMVF